MDPWPRSCQFMIHEASRFSLCRGPARVAQLTRHIVNARRRQSRGSSSAGRVVLLAAVLTAGCSAVLSTGAPLAHDVREHSAQVILHSKSLTLHLASSQALASASRPLVLYASGDGGWFGAAVGMFHAIGSEYPTVGFSSKELMGIERKRSTSLAVSLLVEDYQQIIDAARAQLHLPPETPVVLTGWSRGASLAALVASRLEKDSPVVGLVAIGLAADERLDLGVETDDDEDSDPTVASHAAVSRGVALYPLLSNLTPRRVVVLQASEDGYLPAARARDLFGADTATTRLVTIHARNHRFDGGESAFAAALIDGINWVASGRTR